MNFSVILASTQHWGIGYQNKLPWHIPYDQQFFKEKTSMTFDKNKVNAMIMGRKTWDSMNRRVLPGRISIVITSSSYREMEARENLFFASSFEEALECAKKCSNVEKVFVIGGGQVYKEAFQHPLCKTIYWTKITSDSIVCDTFSPMIPERFLQTSTLGEVDVDGYQVEICTFSLVNKEERQYLDLIKSILDGGLPRMDRTQVGTLSLFGKTLKFNLRQNRFPLLTTKKVFWRGVAEELLWFISGSTNAKLLQDKGIKIWDGNASREYLDSIGLTEREEGDLGPVYGFQWRHFGAKYIDMHTDYTGQGVDQLSKIIETIKTNPNDRRIVMSAWNPSDLSQMALPPCHMFCQFYVSNAELSCQMYQRSCDVGLGVPFNIASYALLTRLVAQVCGLRAGELIMVMGDVHIYQTHVKALEEQLQRDPNDFPILRINPNKKDIDEFSFQDFELVGYYPQDKISMPMAV